MAEPNPTPTPNEPTPAPQGTPQGNAPAFDYDKLASLITGKQSVTEDTVLKSYFKEQGLSADEMKEAIGAFKKQKAKNTPDFAKMQSEVESANNAKVLDDIPALKGKPAENGTGVKKIGGDGNGTSDGTKPNSSVPTKKWNRFNI